MYGKWSVRGNEGTRRLPSPESDSAFDRLPAHDVSINSHRLYTFLLLFVLFRSSRLTGSCKTSRVTCHGLSCMFFSISLLFSLSIARYCTEMSAKYKILQYRVKESKIFVYVIIVVWHNDLVIVNAIVFIRGALLRYNSNEPVVSNCEHFTTLFQ